MFSDRRVREALAGFVRVKADPRDKNVDPTLFQKYKSTRVFPEVVLLSPHGAVLGRLTDYRPARVAETLQRIIATVHQSQ